MVAEREQNEAKNGTELKRNGSLIMHKLSSALDKGKSKD